MGKKPSNSILVLRLPVARNSPLLSPLSEENVCRREGGSAYSESRGGRGPILGGFTQISPLGKIWRDVGGGGGGGIGRGECSVIYRRRKREGGPLLVR